MDWLHRTNMVRHAGDTRGDEHTFDFFNRQRSQALHTRFLMLSWASIESDR